jgi:DNA (cytosine-5)-methyltransferase 1
MKVATVCTGVGAPEQAIKELGWNHEIVFGCEIDKCARTTYQANFDPHTLYTDMTAESWEGDHYYSDLFVGGIPCQAFSLAGKRLGKLDPRGLLFYNFYDYVKKQQPKAFMIENVKGLLSDANGTTFQNWLQLLGDSVNYQNVMFPHPDSLGYNLHWTVLNSKDFGVPQNRERVFLIGIRKDLPNEFRFPKGFPLKLRLKDVLESKVDEKYYLSDKMLEHLHTRKDNFNGGKVNYKDGDDVASCINTSSGKLDISDNIIVEGEVTPNSQAGKVYSQEGIMPTITAGTHGYALGYINHAQRTMIEEYPFCVAMRGRNPENPSSRKKGDHFVQTLEVNTQGTINTLTSVQKDNLIIEPAYCKDELILVGGIKGDRFIEGGEFQDYAQAVRVYDDAGLSVTLSSQGGGQWAKTGLYKTRNRIRRLTPRECFRLQGFPDSYDITQVSDTQAYKQAGNSITVNVLKAIFKNLEYLFL